MVAYDSSYEDNEDGWSVVGVCGTELVGMTDGASLGAPGRFDPLIETIDDDDDHEDVLGDKFFDCPCDDPEFRFVIREERRAKQQQRRRQKGQQREGRTARKRAAAKIVTVQRINRDATVTRVKQSHQVRKRLCWLVAKLRRTVQLWCALIGETRACYGAREPDITEWRLLESQMEQHLAQDEQFWEGAVADSRHRAKLVCFGEEQRMESSMEQMSRFRKIAVDGKSGRFESEKHLAEWHAGSADRARDRKVYDAERRARKERRTGSYLNMDFDDCGRTGFDMGVQLVNGQGEDCDDFMDDLCYTNVTGY